MREKTAEVKTACVGCRFAEWKKTANGRRHPDGKGRCTYQFPDLPLPLWAENNYGHWNATTVAEYISGHRGIYYTSVLYRPCRARDGQ